MSKLEKALKSVVAKYKFKMGDFTFSKSGDDNYTFEGKAGDESIEGTITIVERDHGGESYDSVDYVEIEDSKIEEQLEDLEQFFDSNLHTIQKAK